MTKPSIPRTARTLALVATLALIASCDDGASLLGPEDAARSGGDAVLSVWWPTEGEWLEGEHPFQARLEGWSLSDYRMFWQVDGDRLNEMGDSHDPAPHKRALVDLTGWTWRGAGPYEVTFVARARRGNRVLARETVTIYVGTRPEDDEAGDDDADDGPDPGDDDAGDDGSEDSEPDDEGSDDSDPGDDGSEDSDDTPPPGDASPLASAPFYEDPDSNARRQADEWRSSRPEDAAMMDRIADRSQADWFGDWSGDIRAAVDARTRTIEAAGALPVYVAYNIPVRDCNSYSGGGATSASAYRSWIRGFADGLAGRAAAVILEPDAVALMDCLSSSQRRERLELLRDAVDVLVSAGAFVYIDAGHPAWLPVSTAASRLRDAGVERAAGFALNTSNFQTTASNISYGESLSAALSGARFVVDTSRNGNGPTADNEWCNPPGRALGANPTADPGHPLVDGFLWVKRPGESDGTCNGGPRAGDWWADYALGLAERQASAVVASGG